MRSIIHHKPAAAAILQSVHFLQQWSSLHCQVSGSSTRAAFIAAVEQPLLPNHRDSTATEMAPRTRKQITGRASHTTQLTVDQLRRQLKASKLLTTGNKKVLAERLTAHLHSHQGSGRAMRSSNRINSTVQDDPTQGCQRNLGASGDHQRDMPSQRSGHQSGSQNRQHNDSHQRDSSQGCLRDPSHQSQIRREDSSDHRRSRQQNSSHRSRVPQRETRTNRRNYTRSRSSRRSHSVSPGGSILGSSGHYSPWRSLAHLHAESADSSSSLEHHSRRAPRQHRHRQRRSPQAYKQKKHHRRRARSPSSSSDSSTSSSTTDTSSTDSDASLCDRRRKHHRRSKRTHKRGRGVLSSRVKAQMKKLAVSCCPPLPERYCARIAKGEYVSFNKLLVPKGDKYPSDSLQHKSKQPGKTVSGLGSWLEAWNRFAGVVLVTQPKRALEILKYQTLITTAFREYPAEACLEYDRCFRQQAAKNKRLKWDKYKDDIFIWCFSPKPASVGFVNHASAWDTRHPFRPYKTSIASRLGPAPDSSTHTAAGTEICIRFNTARGCAKGEACKFKHVCNRKGCEGDHAAPRCPSRPKPTQ